MLAIKLKRMGRLESKLDMLLKLGRLFGPLERLVETPDEFDEQERAEVLARYFSEYPKLNQEFRAFSVGQLGHNYLLEFEKFFNSLERVKARLVQGDDLKIILEDCIETARDAVQAVPVPRSSVILEAGTPFTAEI